MNLNALFAEQANVHIFAVKDLQTATSATYVSMKNYEKCTFLVLKAIGTAGDDPTFTVTQATAVAGTSAKALNFTKIYTKRHASTLPGTWTLETQSAGNTWSSATNAEELSVIAIEFNADELDTDNGFDCVGIAVSDVGNNAQLGAVACILWGSKTNPPLTYLTD